VHAPDETPVRPGRPPHGPEAKRKALFATGRELHRQGYGVGAETIYKTLTTDDRAVPLRLVRWAAKALKARRARRRARHREQHRVSVHVRQPDVLWSLDAAHLGRDDDGRAIQGQVLREGRTLRILGVTVGPPVASDDVLRLLETVRRERGRLPLVLATDNGGPYKSLRVVAYLAKERVLHLRNVPRTPQHNARAERAVQEVKEDAELGKGVRIPLLGAALRMAASIRRLNRNRLRRSLGWETARTLDDALSPRYDDSTREGVYEKAHEAMREAVQNETDGRARRRKQREAILATLESLGWIERTRGGVPLRSGKRQE